MTFFSILESLLIGPLKIAFEMIYSISNLMIGHPGLSIVALSLMMNILVLPLYRRADAMQEAARDMDAKLSEGTAHIKKSFTGDERMMILQTYYRQNNYSPVSALNGSVSLLLEIPFFMAAYQFLSHVEALNGVPLGPIPDLGAPDGMLVIGGLTLNLLPILMTAINVISSAIYLKGFPLKTKIQLYAMAAFFLVFLYNSPSALVFYWTLNNVFSLVKNIFYKIKNPRKLLNILCCSLGLVLIAIGVLMFRNTSFKRMILVCGLGVVLQVPVLLPLITARLPVRSTPAAPNGKLFFVGCLFLTVLVGLYIPSTYIAASPQEYVDNVVFYHPLWYIVSAVSLSVGTFLIWFRVFYWLATDNIKVLFEKLIWIAAGVMLVNYMFFGTDLGVISASLQYERSLVFTIDEQLKNLLVVAAVAAFMALLTWKLPKIMLPALLTAGLSLTAISAVHIVTIRSSINDGSAARLAEDSAITLNLSKEGQNVVMLFLDRGLGAYVPYMMNEDPNLVEQFDGFTYYSNVISFGGTTNMGAPAAYGGYEYTPVEMNKRPDEPLKSKHNEALKVLPALFLDNGYDVTVCDPAYTNYVWIPDFTIYSDYPEIKKYITEGKFDDPAQKLLVQENTRRNFFCFGIMKTMPLFTQAILYNNGNYLQASINRQPGTYGNQTYISSTQATGLSADFMESYNALKNLETMTEITDTAENSFIQLGNNLPHVPTLLQAPAYEPADIVDNTEYAAANSHLYTVDGKTLYMNDGLQVMHYHANMAAFKQLGNWFDYLREQGVYDNTRIVIVSDHGYRTNQLDELDLSPNNDIDLSYYYPLLLVKDFNTTGFTTSDQFMTNADVPTLLTADIIENPVNPFTGKAINSSEKTAHDQFIMHPAGETWNVEVNNGTVFLPAPWLSVKDNIWDKSNWTYLEEPTILYDHKLP